MSIFTARRSLKKDGGSSPLKWLSRHISVLIFRLPTSGGSAVNRFLERYSPFSTAHWASSFGTGPVNELPSRSRVTICRNEPMETGIVPAMFLFCSTIDVMCPPSISTPSHECGFMISHQRTCTALVHAQKSTRKSNSSSGMDEGLSNCLPFTTSPLQVTDRPEQRLPVDIALTNLTLKL